MNRELKQIESNVLCVLNDKGYQVNYLDVKQANQELEQARNNLKASVKAMRVYLKGKVALEFQVQTDYGIYRKAVFHTRILTSRYLAQCSNQK